MNRVLICRAAATFAATLLICIVAALRAHRPELPARWVEPEDGVQGGDPRLWDCVAYTREVHDRGSRGWLA